MRCAAIMHEQGATRNRPGRQVVSTRRPCAERRGIIFWVDSTVPVQYRRKRASHVGTQFANTKCCADALGLGEVIACPLRRWLRIWTNIGAVFTRRQKSLRQSPAANEVEHFNNTRSDKQCNMAEYKLTAHTGMRASPHLVTLDSALRGRMHIDDKANVAIRQSNETPHRRPTRASWRCRTGLVAGA